MSLSELRCFDAVAQTGSFSEAAKFLLRSQPTVTIQVAQLEKQYGMELFHRKRGQKIVVSDFGLQLHQITRRLFALERDAVTYLKNGSDLTTGHLRIGASAPNMPTRFIPSFKELYPGVHVSLVMGNSQAVLDDVEACRVDIGFLGGSGEFPNCYSLPLLRPEIVLLAHENHPAAKRGVISAEDFSSETLLLREKGSETRELFMSRLENSNYKPKTTIEISSREGVCTAAGAGLGLAIISMDEILQGFGTKIIRFKDFSIFGQTQVICLKERLDSKMIRTFLNVADTKVSNIPVDLA